MWVVKDWKGGGDCGGGLDRTGCIWTTLAVFVGWAICLVLVVVVVVVKLMRWDGNCTTLELTGLPMA